MKKQILLFFNLFLSFSLYPVKQAASTSEVKLKVYVCGINQCSEIFPSATSLKAHLWECIQTMSRRKAYYCGRCDSRFSNKTLLIQHLVRPTGNEAKEAESCRYAYNKSLEEARDSANVAIAEIVALNEPLWEHPQSPQVLLEPRADNEKLEYWQEYDKEMLARFKIN